MYRRNIIFLSATVIILLQISSVHAAMQTGKIDTDTLLGTTNTDIIYGDPIADDAAPLSVKLINQGKNTEGEPRHADDVSSISNYGNVFSPDGRKLLFSSWAGNLISQRRPPLPNTNQYYSASQVYLKDLETGAITIVSARRSVNWYVGSGEANLSPDGKKAVFFTHDACLASLENDKVCSDEDRIPASEKGYLVVKDLETGKLTTLSRHKETGELAPSSYYAPSFSPDGSMIVFGEGHYGCRCGKIYLVKYTGHPDDYKTKTLVSTDENGKALKGASSQPTFSPDSRSIAFVSRVWNFEGTYYGSDNVYVKDLPDDPFESFSVKGKLSIVSAPFQWDKVSHGSCYGSSSPSFSPDGMRIAFVTNCTLSPLDKAEEDENTNETGLDVYVKTRTSLEEDWSQGPVELVSVDINGDQGKTKVGVEFYHYPLFKTIFSPDGTKIAFIADYNKKLPSALASKHGSYSGLHSYVKDLTSKELYLVTLSKKGKIIDNRKVADTGEKDFYCGGYHLGSCMSHAFSPDGESLVFAHGARFQNLYLAKLPPSAGGDDTLEGGEGNDWLYGRAGDDKVNGGAGNDIIDGGRGGDLMEGGMGSDVYIVDHAGDIVNETSAVPPGDNIASPASIQQAIAAAALGERDTVRTSVSFTLPQDIEDLVLVGKKNIDGAGNALDNVISAGTGKNRLFGGGGADFFVFTTSDDSRPGKKMDHILDFKAQEGDKIDLSRIDANTRKYGNQRFRFIGSKRFSGRPGELRLRRGILTADTDGNGKPDFAVKVTGKVSRQDIKL